MKIRLGDILIAALVAAAALLLLFARVPTQGDAIAVVLRDGEEIARIDLAAVEQTQEVRIEDVDVIITAEHGRIRFTQSSCPDQTCVHTGWLENAGDTAVCLPNKIVVKIIGETNDIDVIAE